MNDIIQVSRQGVRKMADEVRTATDYIYSAQRLFNRLESISNEPQQALKNKDSEIIGIFDSVMLHKSLINRYLESTKIFMLRTSAHLDAYMSYREEGAAE